MKINIFKRALEATKKNQNEDQEYNCSIICVEPYEQKWLEELKVDVIRKKVEIIGALNFLKNNYFNEIGDKLPILKSQPNREPGAFWIKKIA